MLDKPLITQYPDRKATNLRNSNWLQQLDGNDYEAVKQLNHNIMRDQEKQLLIKPYAQASGVPLQEVRSMHAQTAHEPEYHNMAAGNDEQVPMEQDHEPLIGQDHEARYSQMFGPPIDTTNEEIHTVVER